MSDQTIDIKINTIVSDAGGENSIAGIRKSIKALKSEALAIGESGKGFKALTQRANELQDKLDDLKDSAKSLQGTGIEKLNSSFGLLKESFNNADFGKASTAFKGLGTAMSAIPIFLILEGVKFLFEAFDKLKNSSGLLGQAFRFIGDAIDTVIRTVTDFTDKIGLTSIAAEKAAAKTIESAKKQQAAVTSFYDAQIEKAEAAGENTLKLEKDKQQAILKTLKIQIDSIIATAKANGHYSEEQIKQIEEIGKAAAEVNKDLAVAVAKDTKEKADTVKKANEDRIKDEQTLLKQIADAKINAIKNDEERDFTKAISDRQKRDEEIKESKASKNTKDEAYKASELQLATDLAKINKDAADKKKAVDDKAAADKKTLDDKATADAIQAKKDNAIAIEIEDKHSFSSRLNTLKVNYDIEIAAAKDNAEKKRLINAKYKEDVNKIQTEEVKSTYDNLNKKVQAVNKYTQAIGGALQSVVGIFQAINDLNKQEAEQDTKNRQEKLDRDLSDLEYAKETELAQIGLTEEQKAAINNKYAQQEYELKLEEYNKSTELKKAAFEQDKTLKIASSIIATISGAVAAFAGAFQLGPIAGPIVGALLAAAVVASGAIQVAAIENQKFDRGTPPVPPRVSIPSGAGSINNTSNRVNSDISLKGIGRSTNGNPISNEPIRAYVVSQDITSAQNKNAIIERRSTF